MNAFCRQLRLNSLCKYEFSMEDQLAALQALTFEVSRRFEAFGLMFDPFRADHS